MNRRYRLLQDTSTIQLAKTVNKMLSRDEGHNNEWVPVGGVSASYDARRQMTTYTQAMLLRRINND